MGTLEGNSDEGRGVVGLSRPGYLPFTTAVSSRLEEFGIKDPNFPGSLDGYLKAITDPTFNVLAVGVIVTSEPDQGVIVHTAFSGPLDIHDEHQKFERNALLDKWVDYPANPVAFLLSGSNHYPTVESFKEDALGEFDGILIGSTTPEEIRRQLLITLQVI